MSAVKDLTGRRFGRLQVLAVARNYNNTNKTYWLCRCDCGKEKYIYAYSLTSGNTQSCGCINTEGTIKRNTKHNMYHTTFHRRYRSMVNRVTCKKGHKYKFYGSKGISMCDEWLSFENFKRDMYAGFLEHVAQYGEKDTTLDRIDNSKGYSKENCRWATLSEQSDNRTHIKRVEINGETLTFAAIEKRYGIPSKIVQQRFERNWPAERLIEPVRRQKNNATNA